MRPILGLLSAGPASRPFGQEQPVYLGSVTWMARASFLKLPASSSSGVVLATKGAGALYPQIPQPTGSYSTQKPVGILILNLRARGQVPISVRVIW